jgi:hypothetical protein
MCTGVVAELEHQQARSMARLAEQVGRILMPLYIPGDTYSLQVIV